MTHEHNGEAGFTLVEAMVAMVILAFGLMAVSNLFIVSGSSNQTGSHSTAATTQAAEVMERLMAIPFDQLTVGGGATPVNLAIDPQAAVACEEPSPGKPIVAPQVADCVVPGNFTAARWVEGVGLIETKWQIINPGAAGIPTYFIRVRSESRAPIVGGPRSRAEFTIFRTCTTAGCP